LTYLDYIIVYSSTFEQHLKDLSLVLKLLESAGVSLKLKKCHFSAPNVQYRGFRVGHAGLEVDDSKIMAFQKAHPPCTKTVLRRFLGMTGFYRKFIPNYAKVSAPLNRFLKADQSETFELDEAAIDAHSLFKQAIENSPMLALPRAQGVYVLETDASAAQLGVVLLQEQEDGNFRPLGYWSRHCTKAEQNYSPMESEALAIVWGIKMCRPYLERTHFIVRSDHQALRWLFSTTSTDGNPRVVRWKLAFSAYRFTVDYKTCASHKVADELSRIYTDGLSPVSDDPSEDEFIPCLVVPVEPNHNLLPPPTYPRPSPLLRAPLPFDAITSDDLVEAQASDFGVKIFIDNSKKGAR
jgi:RNase H-like domain found in reverse transcriptase